MNLKLSNSALSKVSNQPKAPTMKNMRANEEEGDWSASKPGSIQTVEWTWGQHRIYNKHVVREQ